MKNEIKKIYRCDVCNQPCSQLYGFNIDGKYKEICVKCYSKKI